jgi:hypothetical protein
MKPGGGKASGGGEKPGIGGGAAAKPGAQRRQMAISPIWPRLASVPKLSL